MQHLLQDEVAPVARGIPLQGDIRVTTLQRSQCEMTRLWAHAPHNKHKITFKCSGMAKCICFGRMMSKTFAAVLFVAAMTCVFAAPEPVDNWIEAEDSNGAVRGPRPRRS